MDVSSRENVQIVLRGKTVPRNYIWQEFLDLSAKEPNRIICQAIPSHAKTRNKHEEL